MDILDEARVIEFAKRNNPDLIFHTAALVDLRKCESDHSLADRINIFGTEHIANAARLIGAKLVYISTACVFSGDDGKAPYSESSIPKPKHYYGITKQIAEEIVNVIVPDNHLIIRTNFVARSPWKYPKAFTDRFGTYLFADDVAKAISIVADMQGLVHVCGSKRMSLFELARLTTPDVKPMTLEEYQGPPLTIEMSLISERIKPFEMTYR
jgi:dTDP-4-dehydrorhamnose reductase